MTYSPSFDEDHTARFVSERTGGFHRGSGEIAPGGDFSPAELEKLKTIETWGRVCNWLRARTYNSRERLDAYIENNPDQVKAKKIRHDRKIRERDYLTNEFVAVDFEGQDYWTTSFIARMEPISRRRMMTIAFSWAAQRPAMRAARRNG
jgi:hypothetical protein